MCVEAFGSLSDLNHPQVHPVEDALVCGGWADAFGRNTCPLSCQRIPSRGKPHKCQECGKTFVQNTGLVQHQRTHTYQKPFACKERGCAFSKNSSLVKHQSIHTRETLHVQPLQQRLQEEFVPRQVPGGCTQACGHTRAANAAAHPSRPPTLCSTHKCTVDGERLFAGMRLCFRRPLSIAGPPEEAHRG